MPRVRPRGSPRHNLCPARPSQQHAARRRGEIRPYRLARGTSREVHGMLAGLQRRHTAWPTTSTLIMHAIGMGRSPEERGVDGPPRTLMPCCRAGERRLQHQETRRDWARAGRMLAVAASARLERAKAWGGVKISSSSPSVCARGGRSGRTPARPPAPTVLPVQQPANSLADSKFTPAPCAAPAPNQAAPSAAKHLTRSRAALASLVRALALPLLALLSSPMHACITAVCLFPQSG
jgi:hypothetical protein